MSGTVETITAPDGTVWRIGDEVILHDEPTIYFRGKFPMRTAIAGIFPGNGSWDREQPNGDADAVWFSLENGWMARPWLVEKIGQGVDQPRNE